MAQQVRVDALVHALRAGPHLQATAHRSGADRAAEAAAEDRRVAVGRILAARRHRRLGWDDLVRIGASMRKARPFVTLPGWSPGRLTDSTDLRARFAPPPEQLSLL